MIASIREDTTRLLLTVEIRTKEEPKREQVAVPMGEGVGGTKTNTKTPAKVIKIGRNDPCPCGSGLKWKKCTCKEYHPEL